MGIPNQRTVLSAVNSKSVAQAVVDVLATQTPNQCTHQAHFFQRAVRTDKSTNRLDTMLIANILQPLATYSSAVCQSTVFQSPPLFDHGLVRRSSLAKRFIGITIAIGNPAFVDGFILQRHHRASPDCS